MVFGAGRLQADNMHVVGLSHAVGKGRDTREELTSRPRFVKCHLSAPKTTSTLQNSINANRGSRHHAVMDHLSSPSLNQKLSSSPLTSTFRDSL
jgi:hypothetical protein